MGEMKEIWVINRGNGTIEVAFLGSSIDPVPFFDGIRDFGLSREEAEIAVQKIVQNLRTIGVKANYDISGNSILIHTESSEYGYMHYSYYIEKWLPNIINTFRLC